MIFVALKMLLGDRTKYAGLLFGISFTSFLVTFAASYFGGMMTRSFALIAENPSVDVWVMDAAVVAVERPINLPASTLSRVRSVEGVRSAVPLATAQADARFPNGRFQSFQVIGVDDATLTGVPLMKGGATVAVLRAPDAVIVDAGGTSGKLETPLSKADWWPLGKPHMNVPTRPLIGGDELLINDTRVRVAGQSEALPRFPPRPLIFTTYSHRRANSIAGTAKADLRACHGCFGRERAYPRETYRGGDKSPCAGVGRFQGGHGSLDVGQFRRCRRRRDHAFHCRACRFRRHRSHDVHVHQ